MQSKAFHEIDNLLQRAEHFDNAGHRKKVSEILELAQQKIEAAAKLGDLKKTEELEFKALICSKKGLFTKAYLLMKQVESLDKEYPYLLYHDYLTLSDVLFQWGRKNSAKYYEAIKYLEKAVQIYPFRYKAYERISRCLINLGEYVKAIPMIEAAIIFCPSNRGHLFSLKARNCMFLENFEASEKSFEKSLKTKPIAETLVHFAGLRIEEKKYLKALLILYRVLDIESNNLEALYYRGILRLKFTKNYEGAIRDFDHYLSINDMGTRAMAYKALALVALNRRDEAIKIQKHLDRIDPGNYLLESLNQKIKKHS